MCKKYNRIETHAHTDYSNIRLLDSTNSVESLLQTAVELQLDGISITDHETISAHIKAIQIAEKMKKNGKMPKDFKLILGNEIYLVDSLEEVREGYKSKVTKFPHFLLLAKNAKGHEALRKLSSQAWINSFYTGTMERVPTTKDYMWEVLNSPEYKGTVMGTSACFLEGTKVNVNGKLIDIDKVPEKSKLLTHKQNYKKVNFKTSRNYSGNIHTITTKGSTFPISATAEHKFLAIPSFKSMESLIENMSIDGNVLEYLQRYKTKSRSSYKLKKYSQKLEPEWIEAKDLEINKYDILKPVEEDIVDVLTIDTSKHSKINAKYSIPSKVNVDEDLLWLLGIYTAEGSMDKVKKQRINFKIDSQKKHLIDKIVKIVKDKFNLDAKTYYREDSQSVDINISSIELHSLFEEWFDYGAINKSIPEFIQKLPKEKQIHFIKGYFLGDGYYRIREEKNYNISCSTISKQLAYDLSNLFARVGINILINQNPSKIDKNGVNHQQWYSLEMNGKVAQKFINFIYFDKELTLEPLDFTEKDIPFFWNGKKYFRNRVVKNISKHYDGSVYCLNVSDDHSFEAEGCLVHNCLGSESSIHILAMDYYYNNHATQEELELAKWHEDRLHDFIQWNISLFGKDDFYLELQPSPDYEQRTVNEELLKLSKQYNLKTIIANDVHYTRPEDREIHSAYLRAKEDERETDMFYAHTYLHTYEETFEKLNYIPKEVIELSFLNSLEIGDKCEVYTLEAPTTIPISKLPEFEVAHTFQGGYEQYKYIAKMAYSESDQDRYLLSCIEKGFLEKIPFNMFSKERFHEYMERIDNELEQLWEISEKMNAKVEDKSQHQHMSSYYVTTMMIVNLIWGDDCGDDSRKEGSLLGSGRGSAVAFLINFLTGITQVNPLEYGIEIPYWRHLNHEMGDISSLDIDLDVTSTKKKYIFRRMKEFFGEDNVIQVCTFGKEKPKSAINTACRGLGVSLEDAQYIGSFIPFFRGEYYSIKDCLYGNEEEGREPVPEFIREIEKFPKLKETALRIEGLINKRSTHAGGVLVLNDGYIKSNALMRSPNGDFVTQFNLDDSQATGGIKFD